ncbi:MAG TPA: FtsW/RodA/SpoVE family cell cycle protein, partial [Candidatus Caenarcaniphilales bacterium]
SLLNMGVATGVLPTTGLPLPLFSYGGSSMISSLLTAGLLVRVARESSEAPVISLNQRQTVTNKGSTSPVTPTSSTSLLVGNRPPRNTAGLGKNRSRQRKSAAHHRKSKNGKSKFFSLKPLDALGRKFK